jgi:hypothetical protein
MNLHGSMAMVTSGPRASSTVVWQPMGSSSSLLYVRKCALNGMEATRGGFELCLGCVDAQAATCSKFATDVCVGLDGCGDHLRVEVKQWEVFEGTP